ATVFEPTRRFHHLFDPTTGLCADAAASITVVAAEATTADALSTALFAMPSVDVPAMLRRIGIAADVVVQDHDGNVAMSSTSLPPSFDFGKGAPR
ncbi:MAG: hypothetical protein FJX57_04380, partial [Alphaproteobacteria bacterium]|nr:hypothetical protein [Alphaproteobacteria bacterium]